MMTETVVYEPLLRIKRLLGGEDVFFLSVKDGNYNDAELKAQFFEEGYDVADSILTEEGSDCLFILRNLYWWERYDDNNHMLVTALVTYLQDLNRKDVNKQLLHNDRPSSFAMDGRITTFTKGDRIVSRYTSTEHVDEFVENIDDFSMETFRMLPDLVTKILLGSEYSSKVYNLVTSLLGGLQVFVNIYTTDGMSDVLDKLAEFVKVDSPLKEIVLVTASSDSGYVARTVKESDSLFSTKVVWINPLPEIPEEKQQLQELKRRGLEELQKQEQTVAMFEIDGRDGSLLPSAYKYFLIDSLIGVGDLENNIVVETN